jgi:hypothetical protein
MAEINGLTLREWRLAYLSLENSLRLLVLQGKLTERDADHSLRNAKQVLKFLEEEQVEK